MGGVVKSLELSLLVEGMSHLDRRRYPAVLFYAVLRCI